MLGERPDVITYTQCVSPLCTVRFRRRGRRTPEVCGGEVRGGDGWWGGCWRRAGGSSSECLSYHTHVHMHNVTDTFPPTAMMSQGNSCRKLLASPNPTSAQMDFYLSSILLVPLISACLAFLHPPCLHSFGVPSLAPLLPPSLPPPLSPNGGCALSMKGGETRCKKRGPS